MDPLRAKLTKLIMEILVQHPSIGHILLSQKLIEERGMPFPMKTDGKRIWYCPELIENWKNNSIKFVLVHEAMHFVQKGPFRVKQYLHTDGGTFSSRQAILYNVALDLAANDILVRQLDIPPIQEDSFSICLPRFKPFNNFPTGRDVEWYFNALMEIEKQHQEQEKGQNDEDQNDGNNDSEGESGEEEDNGKGGESDEEREDGDSDDGQSDESGEDNGESDSDGDSSEEEEDEDGRTRDHNSRRTPRLFQKRNRSGSDDDEESDNDDQNAKVPEGCGKGINLGKVSLNEMLKKLEQYQADVAPAPCSFNEGEANTTLSGCTKLPSFGRGGRTNDYVDQMIEEELKPPKVPWQKQLRIFFNTREHAKPSYTRPSRRRTSSTFIFPSRNNHTLGHTALLCDSSGSMAGILIKVATECHNLVCSYPNTKITVIVGDAVVRKIETFGKGKISMKTSDWTFPGMGGTDMKPLFQAASALENLSLIICCTDFYIGSLPPKPRVPVLWLIPESSVPYYKQIAPYGNLIVLQ